MRAILVFFGVFGKRQYRRYRVIDADLGAAQIECRWCVGDDDPTLDCAACKNTRWMWVGI